MVLESYNTPLHYADKKDLSKLEYHSHLYMEIIQFPIFPNRSIHTFLPLSTSEVVNAGTESADLPKLLEMQSYRTSYAFNIHLRPNKWPPRRSQASISRQHFFPKITHNPQQSRQRSQP